VAGSHSSQLRFVCALVLSVFICVHLWPMFSSYRSMAIRLPARMNTVMNKLAGLVLFWMLLLPSLFAADDVVFPSGAITLHGVVYRPEGKAPFPAVTN